MRPHLVALGALCLPLGAAGGCKWTDFDDLKEDTWVTSTGKPQNAAANWGVAIARLQQGGAGGTLAVLGASEALYSELLIGSSGDFTVTNQLGLRAQLSIGELAPRPLLLARPDAEEVALVTALDATHVVVARAVEGQLTPISVAGPAQPGGATYLVSPPRPGVDPGPQTQVLVAEGDTIAGAFFDPMTAPDPQPRCALRDDANAAIEIRALGAHRPAGAPFDDIVVLTSTGKLMVYDGTLFHGCTGAQGPRPGLVHDVMFTSAQPGSQILPIKDTPYVLVQMHDLAGRGRLGLYRINAGSIDEIGAPRDIDRLETAALFQPTGDPKQYVLAGMPTAVVESTIAGQVQVLEVDLTAGIAASPAMTLFDAQPQSNQAFGRGVAELPFNDQKIIAVAAENDVFLYFRTSLYGETRDRR
jgi:hypothetical protein